MNNLKDYAGLFGFIELRGVFTLAPTDATYIGRHTSCLPRMGGKWCSVAGPNPFTKATLEPSRQMMMFLR